MIIPPTTRLTKDAALYRDWCLAADQPFLPTTAESLALFLEEVPAAASTQVKRLQAIRRAHRDAGVPLALPIREPLSPWREGRAWLNLADTLNRMPLQGWLDGFAGRRDAFLAVLIGGCGFTREQARAVTASDVVQDRESNWIINGRSVPRTIDAGPCPACAVARWLAAVKLWDDWGRSSVRGAVTGYRRTAEHDCLEPSWHASIMIPLLPAIDRHGWLADWEPMSTRSISAVLAYRQDAARFPHDPLPPLEEPEGERPDYQRTSMQGLEDLLEELDAKVEAALQASKTAADGAWSFGS